MFFDEVVDECTAASSASTNRSRSLIQQTSRERKRSRRSARGRQSLVPYDDDIDTLKPISQSDSLNVGEGGYRKLLRTQHQLAKVAKEVSDEKRYLNSLRQQLRLWEELLGDADSKVEDELKTKEISTSIKLIPHEYRKKFHGQFDYNNLLCVATQRFGNGRRCQQGASAVKEEALERATNENRKLTEDFNVISQALVIARMQPNMFELVGQWQQLEERYQDECRLIAELSI
uniref:Uncharacterized protein n=1 Tax=Plectus sambesii TaxID=2011161 RepID=A0A914XJY3_9BILA